MKCLELVARDKFHSLFSHWSCVVTYKLTKFTFDFFQRFAHRSPLYFIVVVGNYGSINCLLACVCVCKMGKHAILFLSFDFRLFIPCFFFFFFCVWLCVRETKEFPSNYLYLICVCVCLCFCVCVIMTQS